MTADYETLVRATVERESDVIGREEAVSRANEVAGLSVEGADLAVSLDRDGKAVLGDLVDVYVEASGDVAAFLIVRRLENVDHDLALPANLSKHM